MPLLPELRPLYFITNVTETTKEPVTCLAFSLGGEVARRADEGAPE